jgi:hypothetical protein
MRETTPSTASSGYFLSNISWCRRVMKDKDSEIVVPVDPMSAFRRVVIDDGVPPPVDPKDMVDGGGVERFIRRF